jgi:opacity protein-like surface antigen
VSNFTGLSVGAGIDFKSTTLKASISGVEFSGLGSQNVIGNVSADYGLAMTSSSVILIGTKFDLNKTQVVKVSGAGESASVDEGSHYSVFVAEGILLNEKTLAYAKLSFESAKYSLSTGGSKEKATGIGYGVGIRTHITGNWFANIEAGRIMYNSKDVESLKITTGSTVASLGISYKF